MAQNQTPKKSNREAVSLQVRRMVLTGVLFAAVLVLAVVEDQIQIPVPVPGVKLGLSNIVVMYALFFLQKRQAIALAVLKSVFVLATRGMIAAFLSLCGGLLSILMMLLCLMVFKDKISYLMVSMCGAVFHNVGQLLAVSLIYTVVSLIPFAPVLLISGIAAGAATSTLLKVTLPALKRLGLWIE